MEIDTGADDGRGDNVTVENYVAALGDRGFAWIGDDFPNADEAFDAARALIDARSAGDGPAALAVIGDFLIPPLDGQQSRDFQTLHFDFGLPLDPKVDADVARFTALYIPTAVGSISAVTRLVPLAGLLRQRAWPSSTELLDGLIAYGRTHGARDDGRGYVEGSLARMVEAAAGGSPRLASVKLDPDFLCGLEFDSLRSELAFFERHDLRVEDVEVKVALRPGELLVFDNLALAHGRSGTRRPGELRQRIYGHRRMSPGAQCELRDRVLRLFAAATQRVQRPRATVSMP